MLLRSCLKYRCRRSAMKFRSSILIPRVFDLTFIRNYKAGLFLRAADYTKPEMVSLDNWKRLLWIATDLKRVVQGNDRECLKYLSTKHVTLLFEKPHGRFQMSFSLACAILGARETSYYETNFENQPNPGDSGRWGHNCQPDWTRCCQKHWYLCYLLRVFSQLTDLFVLHGIHNDVVTKFAMNSTVPVFPATSNVHSLQKVLSDLMTLQEKFRRLKGLKMAWIGPPIPTLNTYLLLCPIFGININYLCLCAVSRQRLPCPDPVGELKTRQFRFPVRFRNDVTVEENKQQHTGVQKRNGNREGCEYHCHFNAPRREDSDYHGGRHVAYLKINYLSLLICSSSDWFLFHQMLKNADSEWVLLHTLPRSRAEVTDDVFYHENNLSWKSSANYLFVAMVSTLQIIFRDGYRMLNATSQRD